MAGNHPNLLDTHLCAALAPPLPAHARRTVTRPANYARRRQADAAWRSREYDREIERALKSPPRRTGVAPHFVARRGERLLRTGADHSLSPGERIMVGAQTVLVTGFAGMRAGFNEWMVLS